MLKTFGVAVLVWLTANLPLLRGDEPAERQAAEPTIRMLVPGFTVRELPVKLTNINDVVYAPDGRLFAAGYDGRIHVLRDSDGDGLEDEVEEFWYQPTLRTPLGMALAPEGLYVVANAKIVLLKDRNGDGKADEEQTVVTGWAKDDGFTGGGVDAVGIAIDRDNSLYFGLGCASFANAYRMKDGKAHYDLASERGTILKVSPDRETREIFCTGYRFSINMAFNRYGDLFATDQEGETWLPGGNPRDELNHIQRGKHYGFPPRHAEHLPDVVDEPPVVSFGPQHQSTCGLAFNEPLSQGGRSFGPRMWEGDAFVCGFSRGKLWRVQLVKTPHGFIGRQTLVAQSQMMLFDAALSPRGELVVSCHVGPPDWGVGPQGEGKLFKISYTDESLAQPVLTWANSPIEVRVAFDRPLPPHADEVVPKIAGTTIEYGEYVRAADRLEKLKPPYEVVKQQEQTPRGKLPITAARLSDDRRTLILTTYPHPQPVHYALGLPMTLVDAAADAAATIELDYTLNGVEATWTAENERAKNASRTLWQGWLPHASLEVWRALTRGSADHERLQTLISKEGKLALRTRLTATQTAAHFDLNSTIELAPVEPIAGEAVPANESRIPRAESLTIKPGGASDLRLNLKPNRPISKQDHFRLIVRDSMYGSARVAPFELQLVPWAPEASPIVPAASTTDPASARGDAGRGKDLFFGNVAQCGTCHTMHGEGARLGPDLSNLSHRDRASILRDIVTPSAVINPDYVSYTANLHDGRTFTGVLRPEGTDKLRVVDSNAKETLLAIADVEQLLAARTSIMPEGIDKKLTAEQLDDLLAFVTQTPPAQQTTAPASPRIQPPPPRKRSEIEKALGKPRNRDANAKNAEPRQLQVLLLDAKKDHGPGEHDYPAWKKKWTGLFAKLPNVVVDTAYEWPSDEQLSKTDVLICYFWNHDWSPARYRSLDAYLKRGGGLVMIHSATIADRAAEQLAARLGLGYHPGLKYRHGPLDLKIEARDDEPITRGLPRSIHFYDESYWPPLGDPKQVNVLATAVEEGRPWPLVWTFEPDKDAGGKGRVFCSVLGHYSWTFDDPLFRLLILRGTAWAAREPVERFEAMAIDGVKLSDE
jgi:putative heme-binding domain-containing protein